MTPYPPRLQFKTLWIGVILTEKTTFWGDKCLTKVDHAMKIVVLNIPAPFRMTPSPPRIQLQTLWMGGILTGKMTFWGDKCLTKVDHAMKTGVLNIPASVRMTPVLIDSHSSICGWGSSCFKFKIYLSKGSSRLPRTASNREKIPQMRF